MEMFFILKKKKKEGNGKFSSKKSFPTSSFYFIFWTYISCANSTSATQLNFQKIWFWILKEKHFVSSFPPTPFYLFTFLSYQACSIISLGNGKMAEIFGLVFLLLWALVFCNQNQNIGNQIHLAHDIQTP